MIKVKAIAPGVYANGYRDRGSVFEIEDSFFSSTWMEKVVDPVVPEKPHAEVKK